MKLRDALKLHNEDEVIIKKTGEVRRVISVCDIPKELTNNNKPSADILLDDGNWYEHTEVK